MAKTPTPLALPKVDLEEKSLEVKLRLKGQAAVDLLDYQRAYQALNEAPIEAEPLVASILAAFIAGDKGFAAWRKSNPAKPAAAAKGGG
jgi:hypothetical protein